MYKNRLWAAYQGVHRPAYAKYKKALDLALAEYEEALVEDTPTNHRFTCRSCGEHRDTTRDGHCDDCEA